MFLENITPGWRAELWNIYNVIVLWSYKDDNNFRFSTRGCFGHESSNLKLWFADEIIETQDSETKKNDASGSKLQNSIFGCYTSKRKKQP